MAHDSSRAAVGCADQRIYVYSLHSGQLIRTLAAAHDLAALAVADRDHFLLAAGKFLISWNVFLFSANVILRKIF